MTRPAFAPQVQQPVLPQVIQVQHKSPGGVVHGTINFAKFIFAVIFLLCVGTCVAVCGSAANKAKNSNSSR